MALPCLRADKNFMVVEVLEVLSYIISDVILRNVSLNENI